MKKSLESNQYQPAWRKWNGSSLKESYSSLHHQLSNVGWRKKQMACTAVMPRCCHHNDLEKEEGRKPLKKKSISKRERENTGWRRSLSMKKKRQPLSKSSIRRLKSGWASSEKPGREEEKSYCLLAINQVRNENTASWKYSYCQWLIEEASLIIENESWRRRHCGSIGVKPESSKKISKKAIGYWKYRISRKLWESLSISSCPPESGWKPLLASVGYLYILAVNGSRLGLSAGVAQWLWPAKLICLWPVWLEKRKLLS